MPIVKLTLNSLGELSLMQIGAGNWAAKDDHLPLGKGSGSSSTWTARAQVDFQDPPWPASGRIIKATLSGKTGATGNHGDFRGGSPAVSLRRLTAKYTRNVDSTADGFYTSHSSVVYPGTASVEAPPSPGLTFSVPDTGGRSWSKDITALAGVWAPARITRQSGAAGGGEKWYGIQLRSTDESAAAKSSILAPDMTITIEIDTAATPDAPYINSIAGAVDGTSGPTIVGSADGRTLDVEFGFRSSDPKDTCALAQLTLRAVTATAAALGPILYTTGSVPPKSGSGALLYRLRLTGLPFRTPFRISIQTTSQNGKTSDWSDPEGELAHIQTATIPGPPKDQVFEAYTDSPHVLSSLNSPDPADYITSWHGRFTRVAAGTSAWDSGPTEIGGALRRMDVAWGGGALSDGEVISYVEQHQNRDDVWGTWSVPRTQTMRTRVGPTLTPAAGRLTTRRPTFTIAASSFDGHRLRLLEPDTGRVLYDTGATANGATTSTTVTIPAGILAFGQRFEAVASVQPAGTGVYSAESTAQSYAVTSLPTTALDIIDAVSGRVSTRDIGFRRTVTDADGDAPTAIEMEMRVAATPQGSGALIERRLDTGTPPELTSTGRQVDPLTSAASFTPGANVTVTTAATAPTGYSGNSLEIQATGGSSTERGAGKTTSIDLSALGAGAAIGTGAILRVWRRVTSNTNLTRWYLQVTFETPTDYARWELAAAGVTVNTWVEIVAALGSPYATIGTVDWSKVTAVTFIVQASGAYTGNLEVRDLRVGTTQTAKTVPDGHIAWEESIDVRDRALDDAAALVTATTLSAQATAGATALTLTSATGLEVGMSLVIAGAVPEVREISALGPVTFTEALAFTHANGSAVTAYPFGPWSGWRTVTAMQPPVVALDTPADRALLTDPTPPLAHTYSSIRAQASRLTRLFKRTGYAQRALAMGPASYWRLSETSGTFADSAGAFAGTASGTMTRGVAGALGPGDTDAAVDLNGSSGYVDAGDHYGFTGTAAFSVGGWAYMDATNDFASIASKDDGSAGWWLFVFPDGSIVAARRSTVLTTAAGLVATGAWHHYLMTYDGTTLSLYLDSVLVVSGASAGSVGSNASTLQIGRGGSGGALTAWNGKLDEIGVWTRALSAAEVAALYGSRLEVPDDEAILELAATGTGLIDTAPAFLLDTEQAYAWDKVITDSAGITSTTSRRSFSTAFTAPAAPASLTATPDPATSSVLLAWPTLAADTWVEVETQMEDGSWIRIDGGPETLLDGRTPYTDASIIHVGARLGDNAYRVGISNGWRSSDSVSADAELTRPDGARGSWQAVSTEGEVIALPVLGAPRVHEGLLEEFDPPGGEPSEIRWGTGARRVSMTVDIRPTEYGNLSAQLRTLVRSGAPRWVKAPAGWLWDPMWMTLQRFTDTPGIGGRLSLQLEWREVGSPVHAVPVV